MAKTLPEIGLVKTDGFESLRRLAKGTPSSEQVEGLAQALEQGDASKALRILAGESRDVSDQESDRLFEDSVSSLKRSAHMIHSVVDETVKDVAMVSATNDRLARDAANNAEAFVQLERNLSHG